MFPYRKIRHGKICRRHPTKGDRGFTLIEVVLALAVLAAVIGVAAQALMQFYVALDLQEDRVEGIQVCRSLLSAIREKRREFSLDPENYNWPAGWVAWIEDQNDAGWADVLPTPQAGDMSGLALNVIVTNPDGGAVASSDRLVRVLARATWQGQRGRAMAAELANIMTDR